jgi:ribosomal protein L16
VARSSFRPSVKHNVETALSPLSLFTRGRAQLAPKQVKHIKRHKGRIPIPIGGSTKGTTLAYGEWGIRIKGNGARLSAKQLTTAQEVIQKKLKVIKGSKVYLRVFPDIPVCIKVSYFILFSR